MLTSTLSMFRSPKVGVIILSIFFVSAPLLARASASLNVTPVVVDDKVKARDILKRSITIRNTSNQKLILYPSIHDVNPEDGATPFVSAQSADDRADSLANWIELSRAVVELNPAEEKTIPFIVRVAPNANPGVYHVAITLGEGGDRASAESGPPLATVAVNLEVEADIKEFLQLHKFSTDRLFFSGDDVLFNYQIENNGNQELQPKGEIRIYNGRGGEVASVEVNPEGKKFSPNQILQLASVWSAASGFGKYKAYLNIDYGSSQVASVQDTIYFWIVPWQQLLALLAVSLAGIIFLALYISRRLEEHHRQKFAQEHGVDIAPLVQASVASQTKTGYVRSFIALFRRSASTNTGSTSRVLEPRIADPLSKSSISPTKANSAQKPAPQDSDAHSAPAVPRVSQSQGDVIDLKHMRASRPEAPARGEVINLKKRT